ncbi:hypothetical protein [Streptomyces sp. CC228A]|uniref:hypothetical protein n=1 Tax=Streptomyces sp. CC228A TaxID=2898186 RepID=UPI0027E508A9|nr:hypothetical protein [Streptomyces sp. CC228A]
MEHPGGREHPEDAAQEEALRDAAGPDGAGHPEETGEPQDAPGLEGPAAAEGVEEPAEAEGLADADEDGADGGDEARAVFDAPVPPSSLDPFAADDFPSDDTGWASRPQKPRTPGAR